jgi:hypothetical protein
MMFSNLILIVSSNPLPAARNAFPIIRSNVSDGESFCFEQHNLYLNEHHFTVTGRDLCGNATIAKTDRTTGGGICRICIGTEGVYQQNAVTAQGGLLCVLVLE